MPTIAAQSYQTLKNSISQLIGAGGNMKEIKRRANKENQAGHDSRGIANIFVQKYENDRKRLTMMGLLPLVYFAHGWTLGYTGNPLIKHDVWALKFGPVVRDVLDSYGGDGYIIPGESWDENKNPHKAYPTKEEMEIIDSVYHDYSKYDSWQLQAITKRPFSPWVKARGGVDTIIKNSYIKEHYEFLIKKAKNKENEQIQKEREVI